MPVVLSDLSLARIPWRRPPHGLLNHEKVLRRFLLEPKFINLLPGSLKILLSQRLSLPLLLQLHLNHLPLLHRLFRFGLLEALDLLLEFFIS